MPHNFGRVCSPTSAAFGARSDAFGRQELEEILHIPDDITLSKLDATLRSCISFCAAYHGEYSFTLHMRVYRFRDCERHAHEPSLCVLPWYNHASTLNTYGFITMLTQGFHVCAVLWHSTSLVLVGGWRTPLLKLVKSAWVEDCVIHSSRCYICAIIFHDFEVTGFMSQEAQRTGIRLLSELLCGRRTPSSVRVPISLPSYHLLCSSTGPNTLQQMALLGPPSALISKYHCCEMRAALVLKQQRREPLQRTAVGRLTCLYVANYPLQGAILILPLKSHIVRGRRGA